MACVIANLAVEQIHGVISRAENEIRHALASDAAAIAAKAPVLAAGRPWGVMVLGADPVPKNLI
jgi:hypothetical protein